MVVNKRKRTKENRAEQLYFNFTYDEENMQESSEYSQLVSYLINNRDNYRLRCFNTNTSFHNVCFVVGEETLFNISSPTIKQIAHNIVDSIKEEIKEYSLGGNVVERKCAHCGCITLNNVLHTRERIQVKRVRTKKRRVRPKSKYISTIIYECPICRGLSEVEKSVVDQVYRKANYGQCTEECLDYLEEISRFDTIDQLLSLFEVNGNKPIRIDQYLENGYLNKVQFVKGYITIYSMNRYRNRSTKEPINTYSEATCIYIDNPVCGEKLLEICKQIVLPANELSKKQYIEDIDIFDCSNKEQRIFLSYRAPMATDKLAKFTNKYIAIRAILNDEKANW